MTTIRPASKPSSRADCPSLVVQLAAAIPGFPSTATGDFDLSRHGILDHAQRALLREWVLLHWPVRGEELDCVRSVGQLSELLASRTPLEEGPIGVAVSLRPIEPPDYGPIYRAAVGPENGFGWRFRGRTPSPEEFETTLFQGCLAQYVVAGSDGRLIGLVSAYQHDADAGHCSAAFLRIDEGQSTAGGMIHGMRAFLSYLFTTFNLRKVFVDVPEYNEWLLSGMVSSLFAVEGRQSGFYWHDGRLWDRILASVERRRFAEFTAGFEA